MISQLSPGTRAAPSASATVPALRRMAPWRVVGATALATAFASIGWQVQRLIDDRAWSNPLMAVSLVAGVAVACCVLAWTWVATENARRLVGPASMRDLPDPRTGVSTWTIPFAFVTLAVAVVALLGTRADTSADAPVSATPLAVAVVSLVLAIPMTYRPLFYLAGVVRQVGGHSAHLAQWMWVPVVMSVVGVGSIVALRDVDDSAAADAAGWAPLWVVAVVAVAPCLIVLLLAWRAASSVEEAINIAASRRRVVAGLRPTPPGGLMTAGPQHRRAAASAADFNRRIRLVPGAVPLRFVIVTVLGSLALLSIAGAVVTAKLWFDARETGVSPAQSHRTWEALERLRMASGAATITLLAATSIWTFVIVLNVRLASSRRRNPLIAAAAWPATGFGIWWIADRMIVDSSTGSVVLGFIAQAGVLAVAFLLIERSAEAIGARRTPLRIVYVLAVVFGVHIQGLGGLSRIPDVVTTTEVGRLAGYLAIGALIQLCSMIAVTEACSAMARACENEADHHNMLVDQRAALLRDRQPAVGR